LVFVASSTAACAGSCTDEIGRLMARINAKLEAVARTVPPAPQSSQAGMHHQPTPSSVAAAESRLGGLSPRVIEAVQVAMGRARQADRAGDQNACEQALAEVQRLIGQKNGGHSGEEKGQESK